MLPLQPLPLTLHVTLLFPVPLTVARNCWWAPAVTETVGGAIVTPTGGAIVTDAVADLVGSAAEVAVTETCAGFGTLDGAV